MRYNILPSYIDRNPFLHRISIPEYVVTTVAGVMGFSAIATPTKFHTPYGIAIDPQTRSFYIVDQGNICIRMLTQAAMQLSYTPTMTFFGRHSSASCLWGVAVDSSGNVYFTDNCSHLVFVATSSGVVSNNLFKL